MSIPNGLRRRFRGYSGARPDVVAMIEDAPRRGLDIGCGAGMTATLIAEKFSDVRMVGVEPNGNLAAIAREHMSLLIEGAVDDGAVVRQIAENAPYDLIVLADVLEHLAEPGEVLRRMSGFLAPGGRIVTSIPNVRHISTFVSLGLFGSWPARERGIHDRTHLRFFARKDILALGSQAGLRMERERRNLRLVESASWTMVPARLLDFWPFRAFFTFQYLHRWAAKKDDDRA